MTTDNTRFEQNFDRFFEQFKDAVTVGGTLLEEAEKWTEMLSDDGLRLLWEKLGDEPVFDHDAVTKMIAEGEYKLPVKDMEDDDMDSNFVIWQRGTPRMEVWQWFDERFSEGLVDGTSMDGQRAKVLTSTPAAIAFVEESLRECECEEQSEDEEVLSPDQTLYTAKEARSILAETTDLGEDMNKVIREALDLLIKTKQQEIEHAKFVPKSRPYDAIKDLIEAIQHGVIDPGTVIMYMDGGEVNVEDDNEDGGDILKSHERQVIREFFSLFGIREMKI